MMRRLVLALVIALLPLQTLQAAVAPWLHAGGDPTHRLDHEHAVAHHHHDDASVHHDDSDESARHLASAEAWLVVAVPASPGARAPAFPAWAQAPPPFRLPFLPDPFLDGLARPPRARG